MVRMQQFLGMVPQELVIIQFCLSHNIIIHRVAQKLDFILKYFFHLIEIEEYIDLIALSGKTHTIVGTQDQPGKTFTNLTKFICL